jgi:hypothetical protein
VSKQGVRMIKCCNIRTDPICVESASYDMHKEPQKINEISEFMLTQDYILYADTFINSIFVDRRQWIAYWNRQGIK